MNPTIEISFKTAQAYSAMCKPLCQELKLPQTAFDILMFLANNPDCTTARDIVEIRKIKANLVSVNVDRLVQEGYLERRAVAGDRRKTQLLCTEKAQPVIARGREVQERFFARLLDNMFDSAQGIDLPPQQRNVGLLFQNYALFPNMTVEQNILCALKKEKDSAARRAACAEALRAMRLEELAKRLPPVDLWLEGHSHSVVTEKCCSQSGMGEFLGRVTLDVQEQGHSVLSGRQIHE